MNATLLITDRGVVAAQPSRRRGAPRSVTRVPTDVPRFVGDDTDFTPLAAAVAAALPPPERAACLVTLIIPMGWCYTHSIELPRRRTADRAAAFQLEEFLPEPLEGLTCAFARGEHRRTFGVAIRSARLRRLLDAVAMHGVLVERITVDALCARPPSNPGTGSGPLGVLLKDADRQVIALHAERGAPPRLTHTVNGQVEAPALAERIGLCEACCGISADVWHVHNLDSDDDFRELAAAAYDRRLPNLAIGPLAPLRRPGTHALTLTRLAAALAIFLTALLVQRWTALSRFDGAAAEVRSRTRAVYRSVFPGEPPTAPAMRLASERLRLERLTRDTATDAGVEAAFRGLGRFDVFRDVVAQLPSDLRLDLAEIAVDERQFTLRGRTTDHRQAERVAEAIARMPGWSVRPPRTSRLPDGGVEFTLRATAVTVNPESRTVTLAD